MMIRRTILGLVASLWSTLAMADVVMTQGAGTTIFDFTCFATKHCAAATIIDSAGATMVGAAGSPTANALTVQPVTIGNGTNANAARVTIANDSTGVLATVSTVSTVTTLTTLTGGGVASGSADSGNPVKTGGKYNSSPITLTDGNRGDIQLDVNGYTKVNVTNANANGQATMSNSSPVVIASNQTAADPCMYQNKTNLPISQNGTSSVQLIALSGATAVYVCSLALIAAGATTVALTTGTGAACVTGNAAVIGTTTANIANSMSLAANGGLTLGNGQGTVAKGAASSELCMVLGTNVFVSGNLTYVQQ